jgi:hypothetical protein
LYTTFRRTGCSCISRLDYYPDNIIDSILLVTELIFHFSKAEGSSVPDGTETSLSATQKTMEAIEKRLDTVGATLSLIPKNLEGIETRLHDDGATLSLIPKNLEAIDTRLDTVGATLSLVPKTLEGMDELLLDMRIAQPVNLSYLTGADCRRVQQALTKSQVYKGKVDGICDGATNAAAREWQIRERRTIAPARSAEDVERALLSPPEKGVNTER